MIDVCKWQIVCKKGIRYFLNFWKSVQLKASRQLSKIKCFKKPEVSIFSIFNRKSFYKFTCLNSWVIENGSIRRCQLVEIGVAVLEEVHH